jgi:hypothetical protein
MGARANKHLCLAVAGVVLLLVVLRVWRKAELDRKFDEARLFGLSTGQVQRLVGPPDFVVESNIWLYFVGGTPVATLEFRNGRLHTVERSPW